MDLRELITEEEYQALDDYRNDYAFQGYKHNEYMKPIKGILTYWNNNKQDLFKLLGNKLIAKKQLNYNRSEAELVKVIDKTLYTNTFRQAYIDWINEYCNKYSKGQEQDWNIYSRLHALINSYDLAKNTYCGPDFSADLPNGKQYKVQSGSKIMKVLGKIASAYNISGFEEFRLAHSLCLNDKKMTGELCLSIHPLDYWTMSDNNYNWTSCMSWEDIGCYRQGTIEMMNSPMVIVAYLNGKNPYPITRHFDWSNKKWRQLFIVNKDIIMGIKGYSYQNEDLTKQIIDWIAELAEKNLCWQFRNEIYEYSNYQITASNGDIVHEPIYFHTHYMYNDVDCLPQHYCRLGDNVEQVYDYSGESQCVCCGEILEADTEACLCCSRCDEIKYCSCCGNPIYSDGYCMINDEFVCEDCYCEKGAYCLGCDEDVWLEDTYGIQFIDYDTVSGKNIILTSDEIRLCSDCYNTLYTTVPIYENYSTGMYYVYIDDIKNSKLSRIVPYSLETTVRIEERKRRVRTGTWGRYDMINTEDLEMLNPEQFPDEEE